MLVEQRTDAWFELRKGKITSSEIHKIMGEGKSKSDSLSETAKSYLLEKVTEGLGGFTAPAVGAALEWGKDLEELARNLYEAKTGSKVATCSFIKVNDYYGGSPDALVGEDGVMEIKCPYSSVNHFKHGLITSPAEFKKTSAAYYYQCISHMAVTGAKWCDFVSFDPRVHENYIMFTYRLHRDEDEISNMLQRVEIAASYMVELRSKFPLSTDSNIQ